MKKFKTLILITMLVCTNFNFTYSAPMQSNSTKTIEKKVSNINKEKKTENSTYTVIGKNGKNVKVKGEFLDLEDEMLSAVNEYRKKQGVGELKKASGKFSDFAKTRAVEISLLFDHKRPNPKNEEIFLKFDNYQISGENLAKGQKNVNEVIKAWINSKGHRENMINPEFKTISQKVFKTQDGTLHWVQLFSYD